MSVDLSKYILKTDTDPVSWGFYKKQEANDWSAEEFSFVDDKDDYFKANPRVRQLLKLILGFFMIGDGIISKDLIPMIQEAIEEGNWPKVYYLCMQLKVENTHAETYSKAAHVIVPQDEHQDMLDMCKNLDCVIEKGRWIDENVDSQPSKGLRNVACGCGEGIGFVSQFSIIFYIRKLGLFKDFIVSNEQISGDETIHCEEKCSEAERTLKPEEHEKAYEIIKDCVRVEKMFADYLLKEPVISEQADIDSGLTIENLHGYIETLADRVAVLCGLEKIYNSDVTLKWMEDINLPQKTNFYELNVVASYRKFNAEVAKGSKLLEDPNDVDF
jgi:ribonucleotide reductase beta subunit family protein with ferritin-like domain